jgi:3-phenylpropionate/cinnamic acid dioxygenase small subunit
MPGPNPRSLEALVDVDRGIISREIFVSEEIYRQELERVFVLVGKREDVLRRVEGGWKIARRKIVLDQSVLLTKNLTFFF